MDYDSVFSLGDGTVEMMDGLTECQQAVAMAEETDGPSAWLQAASKVEMMDKQTECKQVAEKVDMMDGPSALEMVVMTDGLSALLQVA